MSTAFEEPVDQDRFTVVHIDSSIPRIMNMTALHIRAKDLLVPSRIEQHVASNVHKLIPQMQAKTGEGHFTAYHTIPGQEEHDTAAEMGASLHLGDASKAIRRITKGDPFHGGTFLWYATSEDFNTMCPNTEPAMAYYLLGGAPKLSELVKICHESLKNGWKWGKTDQEILDTPISEQKKRPVLVFTGTPEGQA
jgi:hypothetical protein